MDLQSPTRAEYAHAAATGLRIDGARLWQRLMELARIGATERGGVCRLALGELDRQGRALVTQWAVDLGSTVRRDAIGNLFARRAGSQPELPAVATGSHIDTQPTGGKFDGNYSVLAGLATLNDQGITTRAPLEVCVWTDEEGSRFVPVMMGSGVYAGAFTLAHALAACDVKGLSVAEVQAAIGAAGPAPASVAEGAPRFAAYVEAQIEQGPVLEDAGVTIGVVSGALGQRWYDVTVQGMEAHAGPTPMELRRDALLPAAALVQRVNGIAMGERAAGHQARGTVGQLLVHPNSRNVIPGRVRFSVDFRQADEQGLMRMDAALREAARAHTAAGIAIEVEPVVHFPPQPFDNGLRRDIGTAAQALGQTQLSLPSGAGHDAVYVARTCPAAMIFVPCRDGISHNEIEDAEPAHLEAGANVLLQVMLRRAMVGP